ncbi:hypothetical protein JCM13304A_02810 [Desulfothermus okinawensis JCM 13304]
MKHSKSNHTLLPHALQKVTCKHFSYYLQTILIVYNNPKIGIEFSKKKGNIVAFDWETLIRKA